jgi:ABC-type multidrug transport system fused ATPase/permease subunit
MVPVSRLGVLNGRLKIDWVIWSASGIPEKVYAEIQPKRGTIVFEDGEDRTFAEMPVASDPTWNVESVYFAKLDPLTFTTFPDTCLERRCTTGTNSQVAVYSLNTNSFPAGIDCKRSLVKLIFGFLVHNYTEIPSETVKGILCSFFPCVHYYFSARTLELILNCSGGGCDDLPGLELLEGFGFGMGLLWLLACAQFLLFILQVFFQRLQQKLRLDGKATRMLRTNMYTTMIQLSQEAKSSFDPGDVPKSLDTQVSDAITRCWMNFFVLVELSLICVVQWFLTYQMASESPEISSNARMMLQSTSPTMILVMVLIMCLRSRKQFFQFSDANQADESWSAFVTMTEFCIPLILSYRQGHLAARTFNDVHQKFNKANAAACDFSHGTIWRIRTFFQLVFFGVVVLGGMTVQRGYLKIGGFVVLMNAVLGLGSTLTELTNVINEMVIGCAAVRKIADILNKDTRRRVRWRNKEKHPCPPRKCPWLENMKDEEICITFENVEYTYPDSEIASVCPTNLELTCRALVCFPEETLCACKKWGSGIATLFKLMACDLPPSGGSQELFPASWSVICLPAQPILFDGTLMYNLAYSESQSQAPVSTEDIWNMCRSLGMSSHLIGDEDLDVGFNGEHLKFSDRIIVSLARALLYNADVLLISSALDVLGEHHGLQVLRFLRGYIQRGELSQDPKRLHQRGLLPLKFRHLKTVLYMSKFGVLQHEADQNVVALVTPPDDIPTPKAQSNDVPELS